MDYASAVALLAQLLDATLQSKADSKAEEEAAKPIALVFEQTLLDIHSIAASLKTLAYVEHKRAVNEGIITE